MPPKRKRKSDDSSMKESKEEGIEPPKEAVIERLWQGPVGFPDFLQGYASLSDFFVEHPELNPYTLAPWSMDDFAFLTNYSDLMSYKSSIADTVMDTNEPVLAADEPVTAVDGPVPVQVSADEPPSKALTREELREARIKHYQKLLNRGETHEFK